MKAILFVCLLLVATTQMAAAISRSEIIALLQTGDYTLDRVLQLFNALQVQEQQDLVDLDEAYAAQQPVLTDILHAAQDVLQAKEDECAAIETVLGGLNTQLSNLQANVQSATDKIASNEASVKAKEDATCAQALLLINKIAQNQDALDFLNYLRSQVSSAFPAYLATNPAVLLELKQAFAGKSTDHVLGVLTKHHLLALLQQGYQGENDEELDADFDVTARTSAQVGTEHIDNTQGALDEVSLGNVEQNQAYYIQQLLGYIDRLIAQIQDSTANLQRQEQELVQALIDYINQVKDENFVLNQYIKQATAAIADLVNTIADTVESLATCNGQIPALQEAENSAQENLDSYVAAYNTRRENLVNTIALLGEVIQIYTEQVVNVASDAYRQRTEDFISDDDFDQTADYTTRQTTGAITDYSS